VKSSKRTRISAVVAVLALGLGGGAITVSLLAHDGNANPGTSAPASTATASSRTPSATATSTADHGPRPPATGAWVGAWVKPSVPTQTGRVSAVTGFEHQIGRPLAVAHTFHKWNDDFPSPADIQLAQGRVLMISWAGEDTRVIQSGRYDALIRARAEAIKAWGVPVLLRFRWEMNRPNLGALVWSPADYIAAWKHVRAIFSSVGASNAAWVWCPIATDFDATNGAAFYPGDDQVDWLCTDVYPGPDYASFSTVAAQFLSFAAGHPTKPIIIGEFGAENTQPTKRSQWISDAAAFVATQPQIKAWVYFEAQSVENGVSRDFTLSGTKGPMQAFTSMAAEPYFNPPVP